MMTTAVSSFNMCSRSI